MKGIWIFCVLVVLTSCTGQDHSLQGEWQVKTPFYKASYRLLEYGNGWSALILHYDDGTSRFNHSPEKPRLLFAGLRAEVDGLSGATKQQGDFIFQLTPLGQDSLLVTQQILGKTSKEIWTRIKPKQ